MQLTDATVPLHRSRNSSRHQHIQCAGMCQRPLKQADASLGIRSAGHSMTERERDPLEPEDGSCTLSIAC